MILLSVRTTSEAAFKAFSNMLERHSVTPDYSMCFQEKNKNTKLRRDLSLPPIVANVHCAFKEKVTAWILSS